MLSNPFSDDKKQIRREAQRMQTTAADQGRAAVSAATMVRAGTFDADGNFVTYGRLGITKIGAGFKIRGY